MQVSTRLRALRRSNCHTCGCPRCIKINQLLHEADPALGTYLEETQPWLLEGQLLRDTDGEWIIRAGEENVSLPHYLAAWVGHRVILLIGGETN